MYLDYAATTPLNPEVKKYIISLLSDFGNPSSIYEIGMKNKRIIENTRDNVAKFIGCDLDKGDIIFTSSGSASNTLALSWLLQKSDFNYKLFYSTTAHKSMLSFCTSRAISFTNNVWTAEIPRDKYSVFGIDYEEFESLLKYADLSKKRNVVCLEVANSECGYIQNIKKVCDLVHKYNGIVIGDFTGYIPHYSVNVKDLDIDIATFSGHKLGALKGVGVLYKKKEIELSTLIYGSQENGLFAGTENIIGIASLNKALEIYEYKHPKGLAMSRNYLYFRILKNIPDTYLIGDLHRDRLPNNLYICFRGIKGDELVTLLDLNGYQVSTGSACNSGSKSSSSTLSHYYKTINKNMNDKFSCIRITLSGDERQNDLDDFVICLENTVRTLRNLEENKNEN